VIHGGRHFKKPLVSPEPEKGAVKYAQCNYSPVVRCIDSDVLLLIHTVITQRLYHADDIDVIYRAQTLQLQCTVHC